MNVVHFIENRVIVLTQLRNQFPSVDEKIKVKGRTGKVLSVNHPEENVIHVLVEFDKIVKNLPLSKDTKKKKR